MDDKELDNRAKKEFELFREFFKAEGLNDARTQLCELMFCTGFKRAWTLKEKLPELQKAVATLAKEPMTDKQKRCIDWIEEMTGAVYEGGSVSEFINEHIEEARFQSQLNAEANNPNG